VDYWHPLYGCLCCITGKDDARQEQMQENNYLIIVVWQSAAYPIQINETYYLTCNTPR
jgi:hypothetical protein